MDLNRQIFIDLDGVLGDFDGFYEKLFNDKTGRAKGIPDPKYMWRNINSYGTFFRDMPPLADALKLWHGVKLFHPDPVVLTGVPDSVDKASNQKVDWIREHICTTARIICCKSKDKYLHGKPGDILVDDWQKYKPLWENMGGIFIVHTSAEDTLAQLSELV